MEQSQFELVPTCIVQSPRACFAVLINTDESFLSVEGQASPGFYTGAFLAV
jgi:hypothetical protein